MHTMERVTNVLVDTFPGLALPPTLCLPLPSSTTTSELLHHISSLLPAGLRSTTRFILTTTNSKPILPSNSLTLASFTNSPLPSWEQQLDLQTQCRYLHSFLPLRLSVPLVGGKGGFGSQLRAAGGRMSSRNKKNALGTANGSSRNLDGRRLRTITEAKNLVAYLATKPEMERKEREERRKRWEAVVELAERREEEVRKGTGDGKGGGRKGLSEEWLEDKEDTADQVKQAVTKAMLGKSKEKETRKENPGEGSSENTPGASDDESNFEQEEDVRETEAMELELDPASMERLRTEAEAGDEDARWVLKHRCGIPTELLPKLKKTEKTKDNPRRFIGFDDEDEDESDSERGAG